MRLATVVDGTVTSAAVHDGDNWRSMGFADLDDAFRDGSWREAADRAVDQGEVLADVSFARPLSRPEKVICAGHNYAEHIRELGRELPEHPNLFAKFADTLCGPSDDITVPGSQQVDWEAELAVVIGSDVAHADVVEAESAILGYTVANDFSARDWQLRTTQWLPGKSFDRTTPIGPVIVTADSLDPRAGVGIRCLVNGDVMQEASTSTLVFGAAELVSYISRFTRLRPGDLILTGTPGGVGSARTPPRYLSEGDTVVTEIDGIGQLTNRFGPRERDDGPIREL